MKFFPLNRLTATGRCMVKLLCVILLAFCIAPSARSEPDPQAGPSNPAAARSTKDPYLLDLAETAGKKDFQLAVPTNGNIHLTFIKTVPTNAAKIILHASPFYGEKSGLELPVYLSTNSLAFDPTQTIASVVLKASLPATPDKFSGTLILAGGGISPILWRLSLTQADEFQEHPASLEKVPQKLSCTVVRGVFGDWGDPGLATALTLRNTNQIASGSLAVIPGEILAGADAGFSIVQNVRFFLDGTNISSLTRLPPLNPEDAAKRTISAGGQAQLGLGFEGLAPGEHTFELRVATMNSLEDPARQKITVNVKVADSAWRAVAVLVAAMVLSFFTYKWLKLYRERIGLQQLAVGLRAQLPQPSAIYPAVWVRMLLRQAEFLAHRLLLSDPAQVKGRLDQARPVLEALNEVQKIRSAMNTLPPLVKNRFSFVVDDILGRMRSAGMTKTAADNAKGELEQLFADIVGEKYYDRYWKEVTGAVRALAVRFAPGDLPAAAQATATTALDALLPLGNPPQQPAQLEPMIKYEDTFARLSLLYERRRDEELCQKFVAAFGGPLEKIFELADEAAWQQIKKTAGTGQLVIVAPGADGRYAGEAFQPVEFSITTGDGALDKTYLFTHLLRHEWRFKLRRPFRFWTSSTLEPRSASPNIVQFATNAGKWTVSLKLICTTPAGTETVVVPMPVKIRIGKSADVKFLGSLERAERWSLVMAGTFALVSGLLTFYYKNPVFGSMQDYLTLFLWGVGVDQTKNFLQSIQSTPPPPPAGPSKAG